MKGDLTPDWAREECVASIRDAEREANLASLDTKIEAHRLAILPEKTKEANQVTSLMIKNSASLSAALYAAGGDPAHILPDQAEFLSVLANNHIQIQASYHGSRKSWFCDLRSVSERD